jgi:hypothetical protein
MTDESHNALLEVRRLYELWAKGELAPEDLIFELGDLLGAEALRGDSHGSAHALRLVRA